MENELLSWLNMSSEAVIGRFDNLSRARMVGKPACVYVSGTRADRVLLVAHADTVFPGSRAKLQNGCYVSAIPGLGIGADDRSGCAIIWKLRALGHSLLITDGEEAGSLGARSLASDCDLMAELNSHQFAIEFDRRGANDLVFYDVGSIPFRQWCQASFPGYREAKGTFTDICVLCRNICGVNISCGYYEPHRPQERLSLKDWRRTLKAAERVLSARGLPRFELTDEATGYGGSSTASAARTS